MLDQLKRFQKPHAPRRRNSLILRGWQWRVKAFQKQMIFTEED